MLRFDAFAEEMRPFHNTIGLLYDTQVVRLIGVASDDSDYYYIVRTLVKNHHDQKQILIASAVGCFQTLKGFYPEERYNHMESIFTMNKSPSVDTFIIVREENGETLSDFLDY
jgi:hypothetical protein